jgi:hypothetical protein
MKPEDENGVLKALEEYVTANGKFNRDVLEKIEKMYGMITDLYKNDIKLAETIKRILRGEE